MRDELTRLGVRELRTAADVDAAALQAGTVMIVVNSVCGCAAGKARPGIAIALPHSKVGRLRSLAVTSAQRSPQMPDVPSIAEAGVPGYEATLWLGLAAPQGTPQAIIDRLSAEITRALQLPDVKSGFQNAGTDVVASTPEAFGAFIKSEYAKWGRVVQESGAQVN